VKPGIWRAAQSVLVVLIALALLVAAMTPPVIGLGYLLISGTACVATWRLRTGATIVIPAIGAILLLGLAFTPPLINLALCDVPHICRTASSIDAAQGLSWIFGLVWSLGLALAFGLAIRSRSRNLS
jgi:hypothetical protein